MRAFSLQPSCPVAFSRSFRLGTHAYTREGPWFPSHVDLRIRRYAAVAISVTNRRAEFLLFISTGLANGDSRRRIVVLRLLVRIVVLRLLEA